MSSTMWMSVLVLPSLVRAAAIDDLEAGEVERRPEVLVGLRVGSQRRTRTRRWALAGAPSGRARDSVSQFIQSPATAGGAGWCTRQDRAGAGRNKRCRSR